MKKSSMKGGLNPNLYLKYNAQIIYTSGTTAMPKGKLNSLTEKCCMLDFQLPQELLLLFRVVFYVYIPSELRLKFILAVLLHQTHHC